MNCQLIDENVIEYLEKSLDKDTTSAFESHLNQCTHCEELVKNVRLTYNLIDQPLKIQAGPEFVGKTIARLNKPEPKVISIFYNVLKPIAVAASIGFGILIGNGEMSILKNSDEIISTESTALGLASPTDYSVWQSLNESYGSED